MIRTSPFRMLLLVAVVVIVALGTPSCTLVPAQKVVTAADPELLAISDPIKAEDAFFIVTKRAHDQSITWNIDPLLVEQFREALRDTWRGLELWRARDDQSEYRKNWPIMLTRALVIEAEAKRRGGK